MTQWGKVHRWATRVTHSAFYGPRRCDGHRGRGGVGRLYGPTPAVAEAMQHYEDLRRKRTAGIQRGSRRNAKVFHLSGIAAGTQSCGWARAGQYMDELFRYDPLTVVSDKRSRSQISLFDLGLLAEFAICADMPQRGDVS